MIELYHNWGATCGKKVRLVLAEKHIEWESRIVDGSKGEQFSPEYLKLNPNAYVPTLVHDGVVLIESSVIMNYLDDAYPDIPMKPKAALDRARVNYHVKMIDEKYHTAINAVTFTSTAHQRYGDISDDEIEKLANRIPDPARRAQRKNVIRYRMDAPEAAPSINLLNKMLSEMERDLVPGPWIGGDVYSIADAALTPYVQRLNSLCMDHMWTKSRPLVTDWWQRIQARPNFDEAIGQHTPPEAEAEMCEAGKQAWPRFEEMLAAH